MSPEREKQSKLFSEVGVFHLRTDSRGLGNLYKKPKVVAFFIPLQGRENMGLGRKQPSIHFEPEATWLR